MIVVHGLLGDLFINVQDIYEKGLYYIMLLDDLNGGLLASFRKCNLAIRLIVGQAFFFQCTQSTCNRGFGNV